MPGQNDQTREQLNKLTEAVNNLSNKISKQEERLVKLEKAGVTFIASKEAPEPPLYSPSEKMEIAIASSQPPSAEVSRVDYKLTSGQRLGEAYKEIKDAAPIQKLKESKSFESEIGLKWLGRAGVVALIFGVAFFLKYAFDNNWIGETGRVILGIVGGLFLIGLGEYFRKRYLIYAQILTGGGIAILYLSIYAAFGFYNLIGQMPAFVVMAIITFIAGALAIHYEGAGLAGIGIFGGFLTPILLSTGVNNQIGLFVYIMLLDVGVLVISFFRNWRGLNLLGLIGTGIIFFTWYQRFYTPDQLFWTIFFLTVFFVIYAIATIAHNILSKEKANNLDAALVAANALAYFGTSYSLMNGDYHNFMGFFSVLMALFYFVLASISFKQNPEDKYLALFLPGLSVFFLAVAAPIQFEGNWITIAWAVEAAILAWLGFTLRNYSMRIFSLIILILASVRLIASDIQIHDIINYTIIVNKRFLTFAIAIISTFLIYWFYSRHQQEIKPDEKKVKTVVLLFANFLLLWLLSAEVITYFDKQIANLEKTTSPNCQTQEYRGGKYVKSDYCENLMRDYQEKVQVLSKQVKDLQGSQNVVLSILWAIYAIALSLFGILGGKKALRLVGIGLFGVTILKLFLYDLWSLGTLYRIISSIALGIILLLASFAYHKYKEQIKEFL